MRHGARCNHLVAERQWRQAQLAQVRLKVPLESSENRMPGDRTGGLAWRAAVVHRGFVHSFRLVAVPCRSLVATDTPGRPCSGGSKDPAGLAGSRCTGIWHSVHREPGWRRGDDVKVAVVNKRLQHAGLEQLHGVGCLWRIASSKNLLNRECQRAGSPRE